MSYMDANQSDRVSQAYRTLGLKPVTSRHQTAARAFTRHRRKIAAQDERLALSREEEVKDPRLDPEVPFPFMDLPAEIRVRIYQYALVRSRRLHLEVMRAPALACVSKQLRRECLPIFLRVNTFQAYYTKGLDGTFGIIFADETLAWLKSLPLTAKFFHDIRVTFQGDIGQGDSRSSVFQILATASHTFVNHVERRCPFCIDGFYGDYYKLPHPTYDHPSLKNPPFKMKNVHDQFVKTVEEVYFRQGPDWGRGGLSITDVINLGYAADSIKKDPAVFQPFCMSMQKLADYADKAILWATEWTELMARERLRLAALEEEGDPEHANPLDPVERWAQVHNPDADDQNHEED